MRLAIVATFAAALSGASANPYTINKAPPTTKAPSPSQTQVSPATDLNAKLTWATHTPIPSTVNPWKWPFGHTLYSKLPQHTMIPMPPPVSNQTFDENGQRIPKARCIIRGDTRPLGSTYYTDIWGSGWDLKKLTGKKGKPYMGLLGRLGRCGGYKMSFHYKVDELNGDPEAGGEGWQFHVMGTTIKWEEDCIEKAMKAAGAPIDQVHCWEGPWTDCEPATGLCSPPPFMRDGIGYHERQRMWVAEEKARKEAKEDKLDREKNHHGEVSEA